MNQNSLMSIALLAGGFAVAVMGMGAGAATAKEPCGGLGECKALVEINATDGDIGFHFLMDGDDLVSARVKDPNKVRIFSYRVEGPLAKQKLTETFAESAEPLCRAALAEEPDEVIVTLRKFLKRWEPGFYVFLGKDEDGEKARGRTRLSFNLPAAPADVAFDGSVISWAAGDDLGECASNAKLATLVADGLLPKHPEDVKIVTWEVVFEADDVSNLKHSIRVPGKIAVKEVTVPQEYLDALPDNTPAKIEVGAIGKTNNATFTEIVDICVNETTGCEEEEE